MRLHRLSVATAGVCFLLVLVGGIVHNTDSGLACGTDWPRCHGTFMPKMEGGVLIEHGHRLLATSVGILSLVLAGLAFGDRRRGVRPLAFAGVGLVIAQGLLGALTVKLGLSAVASTAHLGMSILFLASLVALVLMTSARSIPTPPPGTRALEGALLGLVYLQMLLGAAVRHIGAGMICGNEFPYCHGTLWPDGAHYAVYLHILHRAVAFAVLGVSIAAAVSLVRFGRVTGSVATRRLGLALPLLVSVQIVLGVLSVYTFLGAVWVTAHLGVAASLVVTLVVLLVAARPRASGASAR